MRPCMTPATCTRSRSGNAKAPWSAAAGVAIGGVFFTESQFSIEPNTSKIGFTVLNWHLAKWGFVLNDGKWETPTIRGMGFRMIPRAELRRHLDRVASDAVKVGAWQVEADLATIAAWRPADARRLAARAAVSDNGQQPAAARINPAGRTSAVLFPMVDALDGEVMG